MKLILLPLALTVLFPLSAIAQNESKLAVGNHVICSLSDDGVVTCATGNGFSRLQPPADLPKLTAIVAGDVHVCGLTESGSAVCWGDDSFKQNDVPEDEEFLSLSAGKNNTCGVTVDNQALCWGLDSHGETLPPAEELYKQIANDVTTSCGLTVEGKASCWGQFDLADRFDSDLVFTKLAINDQNVCGLTDASAIQCRFESVNPVGGAMVDVAMTRHLVCGLQDTGDISCTTNNGTLTWLPYLERRIAEIYNGLDVVSLHGGVGSTRMCYTTTDGAIDCIVRETAGLPVLPGNEPQLAAPLELHANIYSSTTVELFWIQSQRTTGGADIYRDGELFDYTLNAGSYVDSTMTQGVQYEYTIAAYSGDGVRGVLSDPITVNAANVTNELAPFVY